MAKELIPVTSTLSGTRPKGDGRLLAKVNVLRQLHTPLGTRDGSKVELDVLLRPYWIGRL